MKRSGSTLRKVIDKTFSTRRSKAEVEWKSYKYYPLMPEEYEILDVIAKGQSSVIYMANCSIWNETVAIKSVDLDSFDIDPTKVQQEIQTLMLLSHPNVLTPHCAFMVHRSLWQIMPFMAAGSLHTILSFHNILQALYPSGLEESIIATVLKEVVKALDYVHEGGHIHRDVRAKNIFIHASGEVKLGGFGSSARVFESPRTTFAGVVSWMAPEAIFGRRYDCKADIWSLGITAIELARGRPPVPEKEPMKAISKAAKGIVPIFEDPNFSKSFREMVRMCVVVDPQKRPSAQKLLKHSFFKQKAKTPQYVVERVLDRLPPLRERVKIMSEEACRRLRAAMDSPSPQLQKRASFSDCVRKINDISKPGKHKGETI